MRDKGGYFRTAEYCNMMCRSMKSGQKFQRSGITRNLSREESGNESSAESVSESKRKGAESESWESTAGMRG